MFLTASIIHLAVIGKIKIEIVAKKGIFGKEDYKLVLLNSDIKKLSVSEQELMKNIFGLELDIKEVSLSGLKDTFYLIVQRVVMDTKKDLKRKNLIDEAGKLIMVILVILSLFGLFFSLFLIVISAWLFFGALLSALIMLIFAIFMPRHTLLGLELAWRIKGFKLYMETAEKYRQKFNEKENILEKFLPYAILFNITDLWINKMKDIYGEKYIASYTPVWFIGGNFQNFNATTFNSMISGFSSNMNSVSAPSSSGSGGGGFSGGGGGGGGGGGW